MPDCLFCKIINKEIPANVVYEDVNWLAFLDIKPINLGHTLLVPKKHCRNLFDLPPERLSEVGLLLQKIGLMVKEGVTADGLNIGMNNDPAAGQLIFHAHWHLMPRFAGDDFHHWRGKEGITKETLAEIAQKIKNPPIQL